MDPIKAIRFDTTSPLSGAKSVSQASGTGFAEAFGQALEKVSATQADAADLAKKVQLDDPNVSLEESVLAMNKAQVSFQALVQVRNRMVQAYHDIFNMPV
ncbi:flagellar hook-basal body complex protein FliE [Betaproteobacteria bacterium GR16-43]|nr:flagellar hook-basal body complex protein FliE [Betaproteobacteria bacterium GR16-43]